MMRRASGRWWVVLIVAACCLAAAAQQKETIEAGDLIYVDVHRQPQFSTTTQVDMNGKIVMPFVGELHVAGMKESEAAAVIRTALERYIRNPRVEVARSVVTPELSGFRTPEMQTQIVPLKSSNAESVFEALQGVTSEGGSINYHAETNSLIVTDRPEALKNVLSVISQLDDMQSQRTQVRIEAKIAEVQTGALKDLGIRWWVQETQILGGSYPMPNQVPSVGSARGASSNPLTNEDFYGRLFGGDSYYRQGREFVEGDDFDRRLNIPAMVPKVGQMFFGLLNENVDIGAFVDALVSDDKAELLANPHTLTINHRPARIEMVDLFPYTEFGIEVSGRSHFSTEFLELGIELEVTPHVQEDSTGDYVRLELKPEVSFPVGSVNNVPIRSVRRAESEALARNGQTVV
ncbi:MAG: polysaccharide biosynthesis/export family protein, partial [Candidatus Hydrogenedentes bacterium]|nr:polysaccharide biosynthesis/export family protein [Candidatus Hydrogenedentota bacterium]